MCSVFCRGSPWGKPTCACKEAEPSIDCFRWTQGNHQHSILKGKRWKKKLEIDTTQCDLPPSSPLSPIQKTSSAFYLPENLNRTQTAINYPLSVPFLFVQHFSIYLRDFLPLPTSSTESANPVTGTHLWPLTAVTVTTYIASQALFTATVTSSNDLGPLATCQLRHAHYLNCTDPHLQPA